MTLHFGLEVFIGPVLYVAAVLTFFISFFRPALALYIMVPLLPFQTVRYRLHPYPLGHAFIDLMLLASILGSLRQNQLSFPKHSLRVPLILTALLTYVDLWKGSAYLSLPWPIWFGDYRVDNWKNNVIVPIVLFVAVYSAIQTQRQMKILLLAMCLTTAAFNRNVYNTIGQADHSTFSYEERAATGGIGNNGLAAVEVQFGFLLLGLAAFEERRWVKSCYWALAIFCFYCVMLSYSRGAYVAFLMAWLTLGIIKSRKLLILLAVFLATWQTVVPGSVRERVLMTYSPEGQLDDSAAERVTVWQDAEDVIKIDPVLGTGYDTYEFMHRVGPYTDTHNLYMKVLVETGAVGLLVFLMIFWRLMRLGLETFRHAGDPFYNGLGLGIFLWMICALFVNIFGDRWNYIQIVGFLWTAAAMVLRGRELEESALSDGDEPAVEDWEAAPAEA